MFKRKFDFVPAVFAGFCTTALLIGPFPARAASVAPAAFEIVRAGDRDMACPALATEINQLGQPQAATEAKPKKRGGLGFLRVLGSAVPVVGMLGQGGALISTVASTAQGLAPIGGSDRRMADMAATGQSPADQRKERLMAIFEEKHC